MIFLEACMHPQRYTSWQTKINYKGGKGTKCAENLSNRK